MFRPESPQHALEWVRTCMRGLIPPASVEDLELVASELVTNAFLHGVAPVQYHTEPGRTEVTCRLVTRDSQGA